MDEFQVPDWQEKGNDADDTKLTGTDAREDTVASTTDSDKSVSGSGTVEDCATENCKDVDISEADVIYNPEDKSYDYEKNMSTTLLEELNNKVDKLNQLFNQKILYTTHEEKIVDQMHAELQRYKEDMYAQLVRPILLDIIEIRESIRRVSGNFEIKPEEERFVPLKTFFGYTYDIQDVLEKNNIVIYDSNEGEDFNALKHTVIKKVITPVEELHGKIAESLSSGYEYLGKTISPEKVVVYIYQESENMEGRN